MNLVKLREWLGDSLIYNPEEVVEETWAEVEKFKRELDEIGGAQVSGEQEKRWNAWLVSEEGKKVYEELGRRLIETFNLISSDLDPAHDLRHLLSVDAAALRIIVEDGWTEKDYQRVLLVGAFAHDFGRSLEFKLQRQLPEEELPTHGYLSFLVLKEVTCDLEMPEDLRLIIYYSVAFHTGLKGSYDLENYLGKATQRADREQLINLEIVAKTLTNEVALRGYQLRTPIVERYKYYNVSPGRVARNSLLNYVETFARGVDLVAGKMAQSWRKHYVKRNIIFLWLAQTAQERQQTFAVEFKTIDEIDEETPANLRKKQAFAEEVWEQALKEADDKNLIKELKERIGGKSWQEMTAQIMVGPEMKADEKTVAYVTKLVEKFSEEEKEKWCLGLAYVQLCREFDREKWQEVAREILEKFGGGSLEAKVAEMVVRRL